MTTDLSYYRVDLSGPLGGLRGLQDKLHTIEGVEFTHDYGMCFDNHPESHMDLFLLAKTEMTRRELIVKLSETLGFYPGVLDIDPNHTTARHRTVAEEFEV